MDLTSVIQQSIEQASSDDGGDVGGVDTGTEVSAVEAAPEVSEVPATPETPVEPAKVEELDEFSKLLEAEGIKPAQDGQRETRIPLSRARKMVENSRKKVIAEQEAAMAPHTARITELESHVERAKQLDQVATNDPERYMHLLASVNPAYRKYLGQAGAQPDAKPAQTAPADPMPPPDAKFADGSTGYSPEGLSKLMEWNRRQVEESVTKRVETTYAERFGPIENAWKAQQEMQAQKPLVDAQIAQAKKTWGKAFDENVPEIFAALKTAQKDLTFHEVVSQVLVPKLTVDSNKMRAKLIEEINARPAAAARSVPAASGAAKPDGPRSMEDVIKESIAASGLRG